MCPHPPITSKPPHHLCPHFPVVCVLKNIFLKKLYLETDSVFAGNLSMEIIIISQVNIVQHNNISLTSQ